MKTLIVDCGNCAARGSGCSDCAISALLDEPASAPTSLDAEEQQALDALAGSGLLPPLRLLPPVAAGVPRAEDGIPEKMRRFS